VLTLGLEPTQPPSIAEVKMEELHFYSPKYRDGMVFKYLSTGISLAGMNPPFYRHEVIGLE
jgi:hypothetical protein